MAKVSAKVGMTLKLFRDSQYEFIRPEISIEDIDTDKPITPQLNAAVDALREVWDRTTDQVSELVIAQMPQVNKEMELQISAKLQKFEKELAQIKKLVSKE
jgi:hypothetical protein